MKRVIPRPRHSGAGHAGAVGANLGARVGALAALSLTSLVVARTAGAAGVGTFTLLRLLPWMTGLLLSTGIYAAAPYFLSGPMRGEPRFRPTLPAMAVAAGTAGGLVWAAAAPALAGTLFTGMPGWLVAAAGVSVLTQLVESTAKACSQGFGDLRGSNRVIVLEELLFIPWYLLLIGLGTNAYAAMVFALPLGDVSTALPAWLRLARRGYFAGAGRPSLTLARQVSRYGLRAEVGSLMQTINARLDFALVAGLVGPQALGVYAVASRYAELLRLPALALNYVLYPAYARAGHHAAVGEAGRALVRLSWTPVAALIPMALLAPYVLPLVYGREFQASAAPALPLLVGLCGGAAGGIIMAFLSGVGRPGMNSIAMGAGLVATVALDLLLIPRHGVMGAAVASCLAYAVTTTVLVVAFLQARRGFDSAPAAPSPPTTPVTEASS